MNKIIIIVCSLSLFMNTMFGEKAATLQEVSHPETLSCDEHQLYLTEIASIYIYSLKNFKLVKKFGKEGEGPREFKINPLMSGLQIDVSTEYIVANTINKISYFSKKGDFVNEMRVREHFILCKPTGSGFVTLKFAPTSDITYMKINLSDSNFNPVKEIVKEEHFYQKGRKFNPVARPPIFYIDGNNIVTEDGKGTLTVHDYKGEKLLSFRPGYKNMKLTKKDEQNVLDFFRYYPRYRAQWDYFKQMIQLPTYFPEYRFFFVRNGNIYVRTYVKRGEESEFLIFDMKGNRLKKVFLPIMDKSLVEPYPYTVANGKVYQLASTEDEADEWELYILDIL